MMTPKPLATDDPIRQQVETLESSVQQLIKVDDKAHAAFASGEFGPGIDAFTGLYLLADHALRELRRAYREEMSIAAQIGEEACVTNWWRDPVSGFSDVSQSVRNIGATYIEKSG